MKLLTFLDGKKKERVGILWGDSLIDAGDSLGWLDLPYPSLDMLTVIREQEKILPALQQITTSAQEKKLPSSFIHSLREAQILSPIPRPVSMRDGYAFRQ